MIYLLTGIVLFVLGLVAGLLGRVLGTLLALIPLLYWWVLLATAGDGKVGAAQASALGAGLGVGLLAFLTGSTLTERLAAQEERHSVIAAWFRTLTYPLSHLMGSLLVALIVIACAVTSFVHSELQPVLVLIGVGPLIIWTTCMACIFQREQVRSTGAPPPEDQGAPPAE